MNYILHWLIEASIGSAVMIAALLILRALLRERVQPIFFYAAWLLLVARLLVPLSVPSPASMFNVIPDEVPVISGFTPVQAADVLPSGTPIIGNPGYAEELPVQQMTPAQSDAPIQAVIPFESIALIVWVSGVTVTFAYVLLVNMLFALRLRGKRLERNHIANSTYTHLCRRTDMRPMRLYLASLASPCLFGVIRPRIVLTSACMKDEKTLTHVLLHESCHAKQGDGLWGVVRVVCCVLFWFHPLVWMAAAASREDAELCCDARVLKLLRGDEALDYADTLLALVRSRRRPASVALSTSMTGKRGMKRRLSMIIQGKRVYGALTAVCLLVTLIVGVVACTGREYNETPLGEPPASIAAVVETKSPTASSAATPEPTVRPPSPQEEMAAIAALAESAMPWYEYADMPQNLLAPFTAQLEQDFDLYGRLVEIESDEPTFYIMLKPKAHFTLPEAGGLVSGADWCVVEDAQGNEILRVEGANYAEMRGEYGLVFSNSSSMLFSDLFIPVQIAVQEAERLARNLSLNIFPVQPPGVAALQINDGEYAGFYVLDDVLQEEVEPTLLMAKTTTNFDLSHPDDSTVYPLTIILRATYLGENEYIRLLSDGSVLMNGKLLTDQYTKEFIHRALAALRDATGIDPRGFDFSQFSDLTRAELTMPDYEAYGETTHTLVIDDPEKLNLLAGLFRNADRRGDGGCPYTGELILHRANGETITVMIATDSCASAHIMHGGSYIGVDYRDNNKTPRATMESIFDEVPWQ